MWCDLGRILITSPPHDRVSISYKQEEEKKASVSPS